MININNNDWHTKSGAISRLVLSSSSIDGSDDRSSAPHGSLSFASASSVSRGNILLTSITTRNKHYKKNPRYRRRTNTRFHAIVRTRFRLRATRVQRLATRADNRNAPNDWIWKKKINNADTTTTTRQGPVPYSIDESFAPEALATAAAAHAQAKREPDWIRNKQKKTK